MKKHSHPLLCIILFITLFASCSRDDDKSSETQNDFLIKSELVAEVDAATIKSRLPQAATLVNSGVKAYKIFYKTEFPSGNPITASGLIIVPAERSGELTLLGFLHGTITTNEEAPSSYLPVGNMEAYVAGTVGASLAKNYMVVMPDYIGYGESKQLPHPYQEKASLASACLDMLKAAKEFADEMNLETRKEIRLLGYSEGGGGTLLWQPIRLLKSGRVTGSPLKRVIPERVPMTWLAQRNEWCPNQKTCLRVPHPSTSGHSSPTMTSTS